MKITTLSIFILFHQIIFGQSSEQVVVPMKNMVGSKPFNGRQTFTLLTNDSVKFTGIPRDNKRYKIKERNFPESNVRLYIYYGISNTDKRIVIFDRNFNHDFSDEYIYSFDSDIVINKEKSNEILDTIRPAEIFIEGKLPIYLKPILFNFGAHFDNPEEMDWFLGIRVAYHREGVFQTTAGRFVLGLSGSLSLKYKLLGMAGASFFITSAGSAFLSETSSNTSFQLKQPILINQHEFTVDSLNALGDTAWVCIKPKEEKLVGNRKDFYAPEIETTTIEKTSFILSRLQGNYVLLDFWGIWCKPCLAMIPRLKAFTKRYHSKGLQVVSIAYDKKENFNKTVMLIKNKQMSWTQLFDEESLTKNISYLYKVDCFPTSILIDTDGKIIFKGCGQDDFITIEKIIAGKLK